METAKVIQRILFTLAQLGFMLSAVLSTTKENAGIIFALLRVGMVLAAREL